MIAILNKYTREILSITKNIQPDINGNPIDDAGIGFFDNQVIVIRDIDIPDDVSTHKYILTENNEFIANENYVDNTTFVITEEMYTEMQSNIDYLMLLNDTTE